MSTSQTTKKGYTNKVVISELERVILKWYCTYCGENCLQSIESHIASGNAVCQCGSDCDIDQVEILF